MADDESEHPPPVPIESWTEPTFLLKVWRRREAQLMKLLTVRNLAQTRKAFDEEKVGLSVATFMRILLHLLGAWTINRDELIVQLLDLFCSIDVNGDGVRFPFPLPRKCLLLGCTPASRPLLTPPHPSLHPRSFYLDLCRAFSGMSC